MTGTALATDGPLQSMPTRNSFDLGIVDKVKQPSIYRDEWAAEAGLYKNGFSKEDVTTFFDYCRKAAEEVNNERVMRTGKAFYSAGQPPDVGGRAVLANTEIGLQPCGNARFPGDGPGA
jgi:hypothetical protein